MYRALMSAWSQRLTVQRDETCLLAAANGGIDHPTISEKSVGVKEPTGQAGRSARKSRAGPLSRSQGTASPGRPCAFHMGHGSGKGATWGCRPKIPGENLTTGIKKEDVNIRECAVTPPPLWSLAI